MKMLNNLGNALYHAKAYKKATLKTETIMKWGIFKSMKPVRLVNKF